MNRILLGRGCRSDLRLLSCGRLSEYRFYSFLRATPTTTVILPGGKLCNLYQSQFYQQTLVLADAVIQITFITKLHRLIQERQRAFLSLLLIALAYARPHFQQRQCHRVFGHQQVTEMRRQAGYKVASIEAFIQYVIK